MRPTHSHVDSCTYLARSVHEEFIFHVPLYSLHPQPELLRPENVPVSQSQRHVQTPTPGASASASGKRDNNVRRNKVKAAVEQGKRSDTAGEVLRIHQPVWTRTLRIPSTAAGLLLCLQRTTEGLYRGESVRVVGRSPPAPSALAGILTSDARTMLRQGTGCYRRNIELVGNSGESFP